MKRISRLFLSFVLFSALLIVASYATEADITAAPTAATVVINGVITEFEAYNIEGNNYFKLRDLAFALCDTDKGFEVIWNQSKNSIQLIPNASYTPVGGEMEKKEQISVSAKKTSSAIYLNDEELDLTAYNINGNNYFKLRDILGIFDIYVSWDDSTKTIYIDSLLQKEVTVSTVTELMQAIASNTIIRLEPGTYDFTMYNEIEPYGCKIYDVNNFSLIGAGVDETELINADRFKEIIVFENCRNISISEIKAGHSPQEYKCDAGVFCFFNCLDVAVSDCYLYGCGSIGVDIQNSANISVNGTTITDCSLRAVYVEDSTNVVFNNCRLIENRCYASVITVSSYYRASCVEINQCDISGNYNIEWNLINTWSSYSASKASLVFSDCTIANNVRAAGYNPYLFDISAETVILNRCIIKNNEMSDICYNYSPTFSDCKFDGNIYQVIEETRA